jgi:hypothetical protein
MFDMRNEYRVIETLRGGDWQAQVRRWFWPCWLNISYVRSNQVSAKKVCERHSQRDYLYLGKLP